MRFDPTDIGTIPQYDNRKGLPKFSPTEFAIIEKIVGRLFIMRKTTDLALLTWELESISILLFTRPRFEFSLILWDNKKVILHIFCIIAFDYCKSQAHICTEFTDCIGKGTSYVCECKAGFQKVGILYEDPYVEKCETVGGNSSSPVNSTSQVEEQDFLIWIVIFFASFVILVIDILLLTALIIWMHRKYQKIKADKYEIFRTEQKGESNSKIEIQGNSLITL